jgi:multiple sugar transport system ATP-binding protein
MPGTLEDGKLRTKLGDIPMDDESRRSFDSHGGGDVIVGIRPESLEDANLVQPDLRGRGITFRATIDVVESMGSDVYAYFTVEGESVSTAELDELARDSGRADTGATGDQIVARLDAATRIREGSEAELWADVRAIHLFDPATGENLAQPKVAANA